MVSEIKLGCRQLISYLLENIDMVATRFTIRAEMHHATGLDYRMFHANLWTMGITQTIPNDDGTLFHLPTGMYFYHSTYPRPASEIAEMVKAAADSIGRSVEIVVTEAHGTIAWLGLPPAQQDYYGTGT